MRKIFLLVVVMLLNGIIKVDACQTIGYSRFQLLNKTASATDIKAFTSFVCDAPPPPSLVGYMMEIHADTLYFKVLYKGYTSNGGSGSTQTRYDTFTNIALPQNVNFMNISSSIIRVDGQGQITDTTWNVKDSTFVLHPTAINDLYKNSPTIRVYPNPAHHTLSFDKSTDYEAVQVYNSIGQQVAVYEKNSEHSIDISAFSKGIYVIKLLDKNSEIIGRARFLKTN